MKTNRYRISTQYFHTYFNLKCISHNDTYHACTLVHTYVCTLALLHSHSILLIKKKYIGKREVSFNVRLLVQFPIFEERTIPLHVVTQFVRCKPRRLDFASDSERLNSDMWPSLWRIKRICPNTNSKCILKYKRNNMIIDGRVYFHYAREDRKSFRNYKKFTRIINKTFCHCRRNYETLIDSNLFLN